MKQNRKPAPFNAVAGDTEGTTWALPENAIARFGKGRSAKFALSPNNAYFAVGTLMGLWWYDMSSKSPIALWETERGMISALDFSQNGEYIATGSYDGIIKVLDVESGECMAQMKRMQEHNIYWKIAFSPDSKWIVTANQQGIVEVLDVHRGVCVAQMDRSEREVISADIYESEFSPNGQYVATTVDDLGTKGTQIYIWCPETGELFFKFAGIEFVFSQDSRLLAAATPDESVNDGDWIAPCVSVWDIATGERIAHFIGHNDWVDFITFSPCNKFLISSSRDQSLRVWDIVKGRQKEVYTDFQTTRVVPFYSEEGELFTIVDGEHTIEVWNVEGREKLPIPEIHPRSIDAMWFREFPQQALIDITHSKKPKVGNNIHLTTTLRGFDNVPQPVLFLPDGKTLASTSDRRGIVLWDIESKQVQETLLEDKRITSFTVLPCGNIIGAYIQANDDYGCVWDAENPDELIAEFTEKAQLTWKIAFSPTSDQLAVGSRAGTIYHWDFKLKEKLKPFTGHTDFIWSVEYSPDGKRLVSGSSDRTARLWDVETSKEIATLPLDKPSILMEIAFSPCGNLIAGGMYGELRIWCAETLTTLFAIPQPESENPYALAFSPCGRYLASGTWWHEGMEKMAIRLWEVASGENIATLWGHPTDIQSLGFSPDGTLLASGSFDGTILLWDMKPYMDDVCS
ncbi:MAG: WD40 repeat domain-containing protein [Candidatus Poribacteria bacterium]|nr:WD40 repeat domain-containing protein [Candidatus Poribacteria bacterium]